MAVTIPTVEPLVFTAGETVKWSKSFADYPASEGTLAYYFVNSTDNFQQSTSTADGDTFDLVITAADSGTIASGSYAWQARYTETATSEETVLVSGTVVVKPEFGVADYDYRSTAQTSLDAINVVIEGLAALDTDSLSIRDRSKVAKDLTSALVQRDKLKAEVRSELAVERIAANLGNPNVMRARF